MKNNILVQSVIVLSVLLFMFTSVHALTIDYDRVVGDTSLYTGTYLFTVTSPQNENLLTEAEITALITAINIEIAPDFVTSFDEYDKVDEPALSGDHLTIVYGTDDFIGTWTSDVPVQFYSVKAATEWALYWLGIDGLLTGNWSTQHLENNGGNQPEISHLTVWNSTTAQVPEPTTLLLFGAGIAGLAMYRRKRS